MQTARSDGLPCTMQPTRAILLWYDMDDTDDTDDAFFFTFVLFKGTFYRYCSVKLNQNYYKY